MPQWIANIEDKIIPLRRIIGHFTSIISCKKTGIFTNHQNNLKKYIIKNMGIRDYTLLILNLLYLVNMDKEINISLTATHNDPRTEF